MAASGITIHRIDPNDRPPLRELDGLRVACPERVLFDLGALVGYKVLGQSLDDALRRKITTLRRVNSMLISHGGRGRRGTKALRLMVGLRDDKDGMSASRMETKMLRILRRIKNRRFELQHRVEAGGHTHYLDAAFPDVKLGIECHSLRWHLAEERFKEDARRDRRLTLAGWTILYFTWDDLILAAESVELEIRQAISHLSFLENSR
jgi:very-short-patch-repair endonuclease